VKPDERSFRIALVADRYVNPPPGGLDALAVLAEAGWGAMQLPADDYPAQIAARALFEVAEQAEEFSRHGYDFVLVGGRDGLAEALAAAGLGVPDQIEPSDARELVGFLNTRPAPPASTWSWLDSDSR
jgi:diacylglycerol kinase family enzyme